MNVPDRPVWSVGIPLSGIGQIIAAMFKPDARERFVSDRGERRSLDNNKGGGAHYAGNGPRECARRRRQIAAGQLTESNGLVRNANVPASWLQHTRHG